MPENKNAYIIEKKNYAANETLSSADLGHETTFLTLHGTDQGWIKAGLNSILASQWLLLVLATFSQIELILAS